MSKTGDFLWKLFCALVVFFYHRVDNANADTTETVKLCPLPNQYVVSCSGYKVGFEWLKGGKISGKDATSNEVKTLEIPEYLKKDSLAKTPNEDKIEALRYFFAQAGKNPQLKECQPSSTVKGSICKEDGDRTKVNGGTTVAFDLLSILCSDPSDVVCATCDGGFVDDSLYQYDETGIVANTWKFYTIADCYITDFTDQTGTYNYIETTSNPPIKHKFYYNTKKATEALVGTPLPPSATTTEN